MIKFSKEKILLLHQLIAAETGGSVGVRDEALLESALESAFAGFGDREFYPTKEEKAARIGFSLVSNHAFVDGNKRIAASIFLYFLDRNNILYIDGVKRLSDSALVALTILIAESKPEEKEIIIDLIMNFLTM